MSENRKIKFTTNKGVFVAEMFEDKAPLTTKNFIELVEKGFYDGIIFHRVIDGFMIQGGDRPVPVWAALATRLKTNSVKD